MFICLIGLSHELQETSEPSVATVNRLEFSVLIFPAIFLSYPFVLVFSTLFSPSDTNRLSVLMTKIYKELPKNFLPVALETKKKLLKWLEK